MWVLGTFVSLSLVFYFTKRKIQTKDVETQTILPHLTNTGSQTVHFTLDDEDMSTCSDIFDMDIDSSFFE